MYDKRMFGKPRLQQFEDKKFYVAEHAEEIFRIAYGDTWMYIPQVNEQVTHNSFLDINTPFEVYVNEYMKRLDKPSIFEAYEKNKRRLMKTLIKREEYVKSRLELKRLFLEDELSVIWSENFGKIREEIMNNDWKSIEKYYSYIDNFLFSPSSKKYYEIINVEEEKLYPYFLSLLVKGDYSKVITLSERYNLCGIEFKNPQMNKVIKNAFLFRNVSEAIYDYKDIKRANNELIKIDKEYIDTIIYKRYLYIIQIELIKDDKEKLKKLEGNIEKELEKNFDGEIYKLLGDCLYYRNEFNKAKMIYEVVHKNTRNGMMLLDIYKKTGDTELMEVRQI